MNGKFFNELLILDMNTWNRLSVSKKSLILNGVIGNRLKFLKLRKYVLANDLWPIKNYIRVMR